MQHSSHYHQSLKIHLRKPLDITMRYFLVHSILSLLVFCGGLNVGHSSPPFELQDGDRVVLLGGTYIERMQSYGYLETLLTSAYPDRNVTYRNLGWSGDDVTGIARAVFGRPEDGFSRLKRDLLDAKPTVILVCYGGNEAFAGDSGLADFKTKLTRLLDELSQTKARIVLLSPMSHEFAGPPLPDPAAYNAILRKYCDVINDVASERGLGCVELFNRLDQIKDVSARPSIRNTLTYNGMHLNEFGYWRTAFEVSRRLGVVRNQWKVDLDVGQRIYDATGTAISQVETSAKSVSFVALDQSLPFPPAPATSPRGGNLTVPHSILRVRGLEPGKYGLQIDQRPAILANHDQWAEGVHIYRAEYLPQVEDLRQAIAKKNELYFHRHRPQNETYLFLFRKHEQGNNAVEIPQFDPLIEAQEKEIAALRVPTKNSYKLVQVEAAEAKTDRQDASK